MKVLRPGLAAAVFTLIAGSALAQEQGRCATGEIRAGYMQTSKGNSTDLTERQSLKGQSSFGAGAMIALGSRVHVGITADWAHHSVCVAPDSVIGGADDQQWNVLHAFAKVKFDLVAMPKWTIAINGGGGPLALSTHQIRNGDN